MARLGLYKKKVEIWKSSKVRNDLGSFTDNKELIKTKPCSVNVLKNTIDESTSRLSDQQTTEFEFKYDKLIEPIKNDMFLIFKGEEYKISSVVNVRELNKIYIVTATRV